MFKKMSIGYLEKEMELDEKTLKCLLNQLHETRLLDVNGFNRNTKGIGRDLY